MNNNQQPSFFYPIFFQQPAMYQFPQYIPQQTQGYIQNYPQTQPRIYNQQFPQYRQQPQQNTFFQQFPQSGIKPQQSPVNKRVQQTSKSVSVVAKKPVSTGLTPERFTAKGLMQEDLDEIMPEVAKWKLVYDCSPIITFPGKKGYRGRISS